MSSSAIATRRPFAGSIPASAGIGLRFRHHREVIDTRPAAAWFEVHAENYFGAGPTPAALDVIRRDYPLSLHGVGLSLGSADGLCQQHLERLREQIRRYEPGLISEHLSWSVVDGSYLADLLPLPMTEEALGIVCRNVERAQDHLGRQILVENPSSYLRYQHSTVPEWEFLAAVAQRTGCGILCDINNLYVSAQNHGWDARQYLHALPRQAVKEFHLAGHSLREFDSGAVIRIDDHGSPVCDAVWSLFAEALGRFGRLPTLIEWDTDVPAFSVLQAEAAAANDILGRCVTDCSRDYAA